MSCWEGVRGINRSYRESLAVNVTVAEPCIFTATVGTVGTLGSISRGAPLIPFPSHYCSQLHIHQRAFLLVLVSLFHCLIYHHLTMSTLLAVQQAAASQQQPPPTYPSIQELRDAQGWISEHPGLGLIWQLNGDISTAISIKQGQNPPEPYCTNTDPWHALATSSLTEPKIPSIEAQVWELQNWEDNWYDRHCQHSDPDGDYGPDYQWRAFPD